MSKTNYRRGFKAGKPSEKYKGGGSRGVANKKSEFADVSVVAGYGGCDNSGGHAGFSRVKRGAKKYVRTRIRFHEKAETRRQALESKT